MANASGLLLTAEPPHGVSTSVGFGTFIINSGGASIDRVSWALCLPDDDTITAVGYRYSGRAGTPVQHRIGIQSLNASGDPDGTYVGGGSPASTTFTPPADNSWNNTWRKLTLDNSVLIAGGSPKCLVIEPVGTPDGSNTITIAYGASRWTGQGFPFSLTQTNAGSWVKDSARLAICAVYSASKCYGYPILNYYTTSLGTNGHRMAGRWTPAQNLFGNTVTVVGLRLLVQAITAGGSLKIGIWEGTTQRAIATIDTDFLATAVTGTTLEHYFDDPYTLTCGTEYRLGMERVDVTCGIDGVSCDSSTELGAFPGGSGWMALSTWDGSSWSNDNTSRLWVEPILSDITLPSGGGGAFLMGDIGKTGIGAF